MSVKLDRGFLLRDDYLGMVYWYRSCDGMGDGGWGMKYIRRGHPSIYPVLSCHASAGGGIPPKTGNHTRWLISLDLDRFYLHEDASNLMWGSNTHTQLSRAPNYRGGFAPHLVQWLVLCGGLLSCFRGKRWSRKLNCRFPGQTFIQFIHTRATMILLAGIWML